MLKFAHSLEVNFELICYTAIVTRIGDGKRMKGWLPHLCECVLHLNVSE